MTTQNPYPKKYKRIGDNVYAIAPLNFVKQWSEHPLLKLEKPEPGKHYATCCATHAGSYQECYDYE